MPEIHSNWGHEPFISAAPSVKYSYRKGVKVRAYCVGCGNSIFFDVGNVIAYHTSYSKIMGSNIIETYKINPKFAGKPCGHCGMFYNSMLYYRKQVFRVKIDGTGGFIDRDKNKFVLNCDEEGGGVYNHWINKLKEK